MIIFCRQNAILLGSFAIVWIITLYLSLVIPKGQELLAISENRNTFADFLFPIITLLGEIYPYIIAGIIFFIQKKGQKSIWITLLGTGAALLSYGFKNYFAAPRPKVYFEQLLNRPEWVSQIEGVALANSFTSSFPSGHTLAAFAFYTFIALLVENNFIKIMLLSIAILVGFSRMYLFQHFINDVVWGALIGTVWAIILFFIYNIFLAQQDSKIARY